MLPPVDDVCRVDVRVDFSSGPVRISVVSWSEIRNSVQEKMKQSTAVAASPPRTGGGQIWREAAEAPRSVDHRRAVEVGGNVVKAVRQSAGSSACGRTRGPAPLTCLAPRDAQAWRPGAAPLRSGRDRPESTTDLQYSAPGSGAKQVITLALALSEKRERVNQIQTAREHRELRGAVDSETPKRGHRSCLSLFCFNSFSPER